MAKPTNLKTIHSIIDSYYFSQEITLAAKRYYDQRRPHDDHLLVQKRGKLEGHKKNLAFFCVYQAHLSLHLPFNPQQLGEMMLIKKKKMGKILSKYVLLGYEPVIYRYTAYDFLPQHMAYVGLPELALASLTAITKRVYDHQPDFHNKLPHKLSAAIIVRYHEINFMVLDLVKFLDKIGEKVPSVKSFVDQVREADRSVG